MIMQLELMVPRAEQRAESLKKLAAGKAERDAAAQQSATELTSGIKSRAVTAAGKAKPESLGRCKTDGEPTGAKHNVPPVAGTVMVHDDAVNKTGVCPLCGTRAKLHTRRGVMLVHVMRGETLPVLSADKRLAEPEIQPTDTGARTGDPAAGSKRRGEDIDGAYERGMVSVKVTNAEGKRVPEDVPATLENLRVALAQQKARNLRKAESIAARQVLMTSLRRRIKAAEKGKGAMDGPSAAQDRGVSTTGVGVSAGQRGESRIDGVAFTPGQDQGTLTHEQWQAGQTGKPGPTTLDQPTGREWVDRSITEEKMHGGALGWLTEAEYLALPRRKQRRYWETIAKKRARAERARAYGAARGKVIAQGQPFGCKALVEAEDGSTLHETASVMAQAPDGREYVERPVRARR